jgi:hypothetical protein
MITVLRDGPVVRTTSGVLQRQSIGIRYALTHGEVHEALRKSIASGDPGVEVGDLERLDRGCLREETLRCVVPRDTIEKSRRGGYRPATPRADLEDLIKSANAALARQDGG